MKKLLAALLFALPFVAGTVHAADNPQHQRMKECNADAGDKKGDERKTFMKSCLADKKKAQNEKMKTCNKDAGEKKGDDRKKFMKECLSK